MPRTATATRETRLHAAAEGPAEPPPPLPLEDVRCAVCDGEDADPIGIGEDFEYHTSPDTFRAVRCRQCGLVYLDPRPTAAALDRIYPPTYHAFDFSEARFGLVHAARRRLEARRLLGWARGLRAGARVLDVGCGDGFHLSLLRAFGDTTWRLEGVDADPRAVEAARARGLAVHAGRLEDAGLPRGAYDLALLIQTIEHVADPVGLLRTLRDHLKPGGRLVVVTDNTGTLDFALFGGRYWGGYHFPRHWQLFDRRTLAALARRAGLQVEALVTQVSPVNWVYSVRNALVDLRAPAAVVERFSLQAPAALAVFTALDTALSALGRGALLRATLRRPLAAEPAP